MAISALSIDVILPAFDDMRAEYGVDPDSNRVALVITSYFMGLGLGQLIFGPMSDRYGRKLPMRIGLAIVVLAAGAATLAPSLNALIAIRAVWGFGAAAPRAIALAMIRDTHEGDAMARAMAMIMATFMVVPIFGPGIGALATAVAPWPVVFWFPGAAAAALLAWSVRLPETLPPSRRRAIGVGSLLEGFAVVFRTRATVAYGLAVTFVFGVMSSWLASSQIIFEDVFDWEDNFPLVFGALGVLLALASLANARLVGLRGTESTVRLVSSIFVAGGVLMVGVVLATDGRPNVWVFCLLAALMLPGVAFLGSNCSTLAMAPVPHVAGTAAAALGTISTMVGATLGAAVDAAFDGTVRPFAYGALIYAALAALCIHKLPGRVQAAAAS